jgi:hypothetical protein
MSIEYGLAIRNKPCLMTARFPGSKRGITVTLYLTPAISGIALTI